MVLPGMHVRHKCIKTPNCINPEHLEIGTPLQNSHDKYCDGTMLFGESHSNATHG